MIVFLLLNLAVSSAAFQCYTCNDEPHDDDTKPCHDMKVDCPSGISSCSLLVYRTSGDTHMRKFCTPRNTPLYQYLQLLPGSSMCQNVNTNDEGSRWRRSAGPPASPAQTTSLLCVCTTPLCNEGTHKQVIENTMMNNLPTQRLQEVLREPLPPPSEPSEDIQMQMADAGF